MVTGKKHFKRYTQKAICKHFVKIYVFVHKCVNHVVKCVFNVMKCGFCVMKYIYLFL